MTREQTTRSNPSASEGPLVLVVAVGGNVTTHRLPSSGTLKLGRDPTCDVVIAHPSVSRQHARIHIASPPRIEDLESKHGTSVLGRRIAPSELVPMTPGAAVSLGSAIVVVQRGQPAPASPKALRSGVGLPPGVVCVDPLMLSLLSLIDTIAGSELPLLLLGETGTGKEVVAKAIHERSLRRSTALLSVNCATLSGSLLESELFGHERGAFTGATAARAGIFEAAHGGTLLLDEVGDLPLDTQSKLLRVLESGEVTRLGAQGARVVDVRFVAATSRDVVSMLEAGTFRPDLYYRLNGFTLNVPALRQRRLDIVPLARHFADSLRPGVGFDADVEPALLAHSWPGNVRELKRAIERAVVLSEGGLVRAEHLDIAAPAQAESTTIASADDLYARLRADKAAQERVRILEAMTKTGGNQARAAEALGISRRTLVARLTAFGLTRPRKR